ncbi:MAG: hypothetical protein WDA21_00230 [Bacilli bacterium]
MRDDFDIIYYEMVENYSRTIDLMGVVHKNGEVSSLAVLEELGEIAENMLDTQGEFVLTYCTPKLRESLLTNIDAKKSSLFTALGKNKEK